MMNSEVSKQSKWDGLKRLLKKPPKELFWAWIFYQAIKGTLTTSLIWIPLLLAWFNKG